MPTLAQILNEQIEHTVLFWGVILILVSIVLFVIIAIVKKRMLNAGGSKGPDAGFSLSDLRAMRDRGEITPDEYDQTRARVIAKVKAHTASRKPAENPPQPESGDTDDGASAGDAADSHG